MARRLNGHEYLVEEGVTASLGTTKNANERGTKKTITISIAPGTEHLFTPEHLGTHVGGIKTEWFVGAKGRDGGTAPIAGLPPEIVERYRLTNAELLAVKLEEPGARKTPPTEPW